MAKKQRFLRVDSHKYSKLGLRRKKKQVYRKPKGGENKIRLNRAGRLRKVKVGFRTEKKKRGLIKGLKPIVIYNMEGLKNLKKEEIGILGKIGVKKKIEIARYHLENKVELFNLNPKKFLKEIEAKLKKTKEERLEKKGGKREKDKKAEESARKKEVEKEREKVGTVKEGYEKKEIKEKHGKNQDVMKNYETDVKENAEEKK